MVLILFVVIKLEWQFGKNNSKMGENSNASRLISLMNTISFNIMAVWRMTTICVQQSLLLVCPFVGGCMFWEWEVEDVYMHGCMCRKFINNTITLDYEHLLLSRDLSSGNKIKNLQAC